MITVEEIRNAQAEGKPHLVVKSDRRIGRHTNFKLVINGSANSNKHDLWLWPLNQREGGCSARVYLGSKNIKADNVELLDHLTVVGG